MPVVGLGASAGGLEAIQAFFRGVPDADPGMAFVVVSHLDPSHSSILPELIQKHTRCEVMQIEDGMEIDVNRVYVIPPNRDLQIEDNKLVLTKIGLSGEHRAPINLFFRSLAEHCGEMAAGVVLSGMGADGAVGLQDIKGNLGVVMAQDPDEAKYDAMPRAAINTGLTDFILPAGEMFQHLSEYFQRLRRKDDFDPESLDRRTLAKIHTLLRKRSGHDFSHYKESTVRRRLIRRLNVQGYTNMTDYLRHLQKHSEEVQILVKELLIGVTQFFRDPNAFDALKATALPKLLESRAESRIIRAWVAGCATGEEAYSLAITLSEYFEEHELDPDFQIFATDLDERAIEFARAGLYSGDIARDVSPERLKNFFRKENKQYRIQTLIREKIVFAPQSVIKDPPFTRLDLLLCRNLLIYLDTEIQKTLVPLFHYSLNPGGLLFLGHSETIGPFENHFQVLDGQWKIYQRKDEYPSSPRPPEFTLSSPKYDNKKIPTARTASITELSERALLDHFTPPAIIIDRQGDIHYIHGRVNKFLDHAQGAVRSYNAFEMAREGLKIHLLSVLRNMRPDSEVSRKRVRIGREQFLEANVTISPIREEGVRGLFVVLFEELFQEEQATPQPGLENGGGEDESALVRDLRTKLMVCEQKLRTTVEELESANEELRSSNEEYQSTNEELQSANEELNSSREELQSLNEELETVNAELQGKVRQVEDAYREMSNMLDSLHMPVIFLDKNMRIKRFSTHAHSIMELIETDVGRPVTHLSSKIEGTILDEEVRQVILSYSPVGKEVRTKEGKYYLMRALPYPDRKDGESTGVVISFVDITEQKEIRRLLHEKEKAWELAQAIVDTVREPLVVLDEHLVVKSASQAFYAKFQVTSEETLGMSLFDLGSGQWNIAELDRLLRKILPQGTAINDFVVEHDFPDIGRRKMLLNARTLQLKGAASDYVFLAIEDATDKE